MKMKPRKRVNLDEFVVCHHPANRHEQRFDVIGVQPQARWRPYGDDPLAQRASPAPTPSASRITAWKTRPSSKIPMWSPPRSPWTCAALEEGELILGDLSVRRSLN